MSNYIDKSYYKKQIAQSSFKFPTIDDFVFNDKMIEYVINENIKAINHGREDVFYRCGAILHEPDKYKNRQKLNEVEFYFNEEKLNKICNGNYVSLFHYHGIFPSYFSKQDDDTFKNFIQNGFQDSGIIGIDGLTFKTVLGNSIKIPFTNAYYDKLEEENIPVFRCVQNVVCDIISYDTTSKTKKIKNMFRKAVKKPNIKDKTIRCKITYNDGLGEETVYADKVIVENIQFNDHYNSFRWIDTKNIENNKIFPFDFTGKKGICISSTNLDINKRILTCFEKKHALQK